MLIQKKKFLMQNKIIKASTKINLKFDKSFKSYLFKRRHFVCRLKKIQINKNTIIVLAVPSPKKKKSHSKKNTIPKILSKSTK